jgi:hypothetical protein
MFLATSRRARRHRNSSRLLGEMRTRCAAGNNVGMMPLFLESGLPCE